MTNAIGNVHSAPRILPVALFTLSYLTAAVVGALATGNAEFIFYIAVMVGLIGLVTIVHLNVPLSTGILWMLSVWGLLHMGGGLMPVPEGWPIDGDIRVLYSLWLIPNRLKYDQVVHAFGFGTTTWACWQVLQGSIAARLGAARRQVRPSMGLLLLCLAAGMGFGAVNEVVEFSATLLMAETNVGGYVNTGWDLVSNLSGCAIAAAAIWLVDRAGGRRHD